MGEIISSGEKRCYVSRPVVPVATFSHQTVYRPSYDSSGPVVSVITNFLYTATAIHPAEPEPDQTWAFSASLLGTNKARQYAGSFTTMCVEWMDTFNNRELHQRLHCKMLVNSHQLVMPQLSHPTAVRKKACIAAKRINYAAARDGSQQRGSISRPEAVHSALLVSQQPHIERR